MAALSPNTHLTTLHEQHNEGGHGASAVSIVNTVQAMQMAVEEFSEHVDHCNNTDLKQAIMEKVKALKKTDTSILTERVEEMKGEEGHELSTLNAVYTEKKLEVRKMEGKVSKIR